MQIKTELFVKQLLREKLPDWAIYHSLDHTLETVQTARDFGLHYKLSEQEIEILSIAGYFHDTGYIYGADNHEERSIEIAEGFLNSENYPEDSFHKVAECIRSTKLTSVPESLLEFIICDADLVSLGKPDYLKTNDLLKKEFEMRQKITIGELEWLKRSKKFLESHSYHTEYARFRFNFQLELNLNELKKRLNILDSE